MSKMDALRAMREARYAEMTARSTTPAAARTKPATTKAAPKAAPKTTPKATAKETTAKETTEEPATEALCGHRNMSGRTCTREQGHAAKSHRYS